MDEFDRYAMKIPKVLRWVLILPASLLVHLLTTVLMNLLGKLSMFFYANYGLGEKFFTHLLAPAVAGYLSIYISTILAPSGKKTVALLITCLWMLVYGCLTMVAVITQNWYTLIPCLASPAAALYAYAQIKSELLSRDRTDEHYVRQSSDDSEVSF
jgi:hypothetical protein